MDNAAQTADVALLRARELEGTYRDRAAWAESMADVEQRARLAAEELTRRDLPLPSSAPQDGQVTRGRDAMSDEHAGADIGAAAGSGGRAGSPGAGTDQTSEQGHRDDGSTDIAADIARIQQETRDTLAGIRSRAREAAWERLRGEGTSVVRRWRDRRIDHADVHDLTADPDAERGTGLDRHTTSHEAGIDLD